MNIKICKSDEINTSALFPFVPVLVMASAKLGSILSCDAVAGNLHPSGRRRDTERDGAVTLLGHTFCLRDSLLGPTPLGVTKRCADSGWV